MTALKIYNTLAREKQAFIPIEPGKVRMYVCGMTVYDYCHLGHARVMVVFDMVQRWLRAQGLAVTYVRNITDIDDKIIRRAVENNETIAQLTGRFIQAMNEDAAALGVQSPDFEPRATEHVPQMLALIGRLEQNGLAYKAEDGDVNYAVRNFEGYGKLSGKSLDDLRAGERVDNEKMSKSLGNFFTIREVLQSFDAEVVRFFILRAHYRSQLNYSDAHLADARGALTRLYTALKEVAPDALALDWSEPHALRFAEAMNDDFNTPGAVAVLFDLANEVNKTRSTALARQLKGLAAIVGLLGRSPQEFLQGGSDGEDTAVQAQIEARTAAKKARDFAEADRIRAALLADGVILEDKPGGVTEWRRA